MTAAQRPLVSSRATRMPVGGLLFSKANKQSSKSQAGQNKTKQKSHPKSEQDGKSETQGSDVNGLGSSGSAQEPYSLDRRALGSREASVLEMTSKPLEPASDCGPCSATPIAKEDAHNGPQSTKTQPKRMAWTTERVEEALQELRELQDQANKLLAGEEALTPPPAKLQQPASRLQGSEQLALVCNPVAKPSNRKRTPTRSIRCQVGQSAVVADDQTEFALSLLEQIRRLQDEAAAML